MENSETLRRKELKERRKQIEENERKRRKAQKEQAKALKKAEKKAEKAKKARTARAEKKAYTSQKKKRIAIKDIKKVSKTVLKEQLGELMIIRLLVSWIYSLLNVFTLLLGSLIFSGPLKYGLYDSYYKASKAEKIKAQDVLSGFKNRFGDSFLAGFVIKVIAAIPVVFLTAQIIAVVSALSSFNSITEIMSVEISRRTLIISLVTIGVVLICDIICWILVYSFSLAIYILIRNPGMSGLGAVKMSGKVMKREKFRLFRFDLSYIPWYLLAIVTAGIALIWTLPYHMLGRINMMTEIYERKVAVKVDKLEYYRPYSGAKREMTREYNELTGLKGNGDIYW